MIDFSIKWVRVRIEYEFSKMHHFDFIIPMVRGALGYSLRNTYCIDKTAECEQCPMNSPCVYYRLFESPIYEGKQVKDFSIHPFQLSLDPQRIGNPWNSRKISFYLTLFHQPEMLYPIFITALKRVGSMGLGKSSLKTNKMYIYDLEERLLAEPDTFLSASPPVHSIADVSRMIEQVDSSSGRVRIKFLTPLQLKTGGKLVREVDFSLLILVAARRLNLIEKFYGGENRILSDALMDSGGPVETLDSGLDWVNHFRYSTRKKNKMPLPGLVGSLTVSGDVRRFLALLALGEIFHIGGKTTFGLGQFISYSVD